jgi:hypothetical protein
VNLSTDFCIELAESVKGTIAYYATGTRAVVYAVVVSACGYKGIIADPEFTCCPNKFANGFPASRVSTSLTIISSALTTVSVFFGAGKYPSTLAFPSES